MAAYNPRHRAPRRPSIFVRAAEWQYEKAQKAHQEWRDASDMLATTLADKAGKKSEVTIFGSGSTGKKIQMLGQEVISITFSRADDLRSWEGQPAFRERIQFAGNVSSSFRDDEDYLQGMTLSEQGDALEADVLLSACEDLEPPRSGYTALGRFVLAPYDTLRYRSAANRFQRRRANTDRSLLRLAMDSQQANAVVSPAAA